MITTEEMTVERWINLLKTAGVKEIDDLWVIVSDGPIVVADPDPDLYPIAYLTTEHAENLRNLWAEIEEAWNAAE